MGWPVGWTVDTRGGGPGPSTRGGSVVFLHSAGSRRRQAVRDVQAVFQSPGRWGPRQVTKASSVADKTPPSRRRRAAGGGHGPELSAARDCLSSDRCTYCGCRYSRDNSLPPLLNGSPAPSSLVHRSPRFKAPFPSSPWADPAFASLLATPASDLDSSPRSPHR